MMNVRALLAASALLLQPLLAATSVADKSTCRAIWIFKLPCAKPVSALVNQVKAWSTRECYDSQEKCMYEITKQLPTHLEIKHTSLSTYKTTEMTFEFNPTGPFFCKSRAFSTTRSQNATSPNDYCLLYNLIDGSGLTQAEGYKEISNEAMCPSKQSATCNSPAH